MPSWCWNKPRFWRAFVRRPYSFSTAKLELPWCRACDSAKENIISAALQNRHKKQVNKSIDSLQTSKQDGFTTNSLLSPPRAYLFQTHLRRGRGYLIKQFRRWYQFSIKNKNAKWKSSSTRSWRSCSRGKKQIRTSTRWINHPGSIHTRFYSRHWLIQFMIY